MDRAGSKRIHEVCSPETEIPLGKRMVERDEVLQGVKRESGDCFPPLIDPYHRSQRLISLWTWVRDVQRLRSRSSGLVRDPVVGSFRDWKRGDLGPIGIFFRLPCKC